MRRGLKGGRGETKTGKKGKRDGLETRPGNRGNNGEIEQEVRMIILVETATLQSLGMGAKGARRGRLVSLGDIFWALASKAMAVGILDLFYTSNFIYIVQWDAGHSCKARGGNDLRRD